MRFRVGAILVAILALTAIPTFAQVTGAVKGGVTFSKTVFEEEDGDETGNTDFGTGFAVGAAVNVPIAPMFSFQPEFLYTMKGGKGGDLDLDSSDTKLKLGMFQIPLLFKANFSGASTHPFVVFGPAIGFVTSAKIENEEFDIDEDIKDDVEKVEFSGVVGVGFQVGRGTVEYRYDHGFSNLDKEEGASAKTRTHSILFGVSFGG